MPAERLSIGIAQCHCEPPHARRALRASPCPMCYSRSGSWREWGMSSAGKPLHPRVNAPALREYMRARRAKQKANVGFWA
jgi:hypothetical protein